MVSSTETISTSNTPLIVNHLLPTSLQSYSLPSLEPDDIDIIETPDKFYDSLIDLVENTEDELYISALYLGKGKKEEKLLAKIKESLNNKKKLKINLIFDYSRSLRDKEGLNNLYQLKNLYPSQITISLYDIPRNNIVKYFTPQIREVFGVYHCKFSLSLGYKKNNEKVNKIILTGANLSMDYFTNRQDRYWLITSKLTSNNFLVNFLKEFSSSIILISKSIEENYRIFDSVENNFSSSLSLTSSPSNTLLDVLKKYKLLINSSSSPHDPLVFDDYFEDSTPSSNIDSNGNSSNTSNSSSQIINDNKLHIVPLVQHRSLNVFTEEVTLSHILFSMAGLESSKNYKNKSRSVVNISSPYTSFPPSLVRAMFSLMKSPQNIIEIIGPDATSHGFASGSGIKGLIPTLHQESLDQSVKAATKSPSFFSKFSSLSYNLHPSLHNSKKNSLNSLNFLFNINKNYDDNTNKIFQPKLLFFTKNDWTFHTKGIWLRQNIFNNSTPHSSSSPYPLPFGTYIGSSNFGMRSWRRDFELGFFMYSNNRKFQEIFEKDYQMLRKNCVTSSTLPLVSSSHISSQSNSNSSPVSFSNQKTKKQFIKFTTKIVKTFL